MSPDHLAQLVLVGYVLVISGVAVLRGVTAAEGWRAWLLYQGARLYSRCCFRWRGTKCPFAWVSPAMLVVNHRSPLDPMFIMPGIESNRPPGFMTAKEYFAVPVVGFICRAMESVPTARDGKDMNSIRASLRRLQEGKFLGIFPEGRINRGSGFLPANTGVAWLALKSKAPVFPIYIHNAPQADSMVTPFFMFRPVRVYYGEAVDLTGFYEQKISEPLLQTVTDVIMSKLAELARRAEREVAALRG